MPNMPLPLPIADPSLCALTCQADPACQAFVYDPPNCDAANDPPVCWLKTTVPPAVSKSCRCSNVKPPVPTHPIPQDIALYTVSNQNMVAVLGAYGLISIKYNGYWPASSFSASVLADTWALAVDGFLLNSTLLAPPYTQQTSPNAVQYVYNYEAPTSVIYTVTVQYQIIAEANSLSKTLWVNTSTPRTAILISSVNPFDVLLLQPTAPLSATLFPSGTLGGYGAFMRFADNTAAMVTAQNPFLNTRVIPMADNFTMVQVSYHPLMYWNFTGTEPFKTDTAYLSGYLLSKYAVPPATTASTHSHVHTRDDVTVSYRSGVMLYEYVHTQDAEQPVHDGDASWLNYAERDAMRSAADAAYLNPPAQTVKINVAWTENDYQIDIVNATSLAEYTRIVQRLAQIGVQHVLYGAANSAISSIGNGTDDWGWENVLWINEGERIRKNVWMPGRDAIQPSVQPLLMTAKQAGVQLIPYIYPILGFEQNPDWLGPAWGGHTYAKLQNRELQDFLVQTIADFTAAMGSGGAGFDYTVFWSNQATAYAQWFGWRRVLMNLRSKQGANFVVDNRQDNHHWGPWMWVAGSYAEPLQSDEEAESWNAYLWDPHTDRENANRVRQMNYLYAQMMFCPQSAMPGFVHHNTDRFTPSGATPRTDFNIRDYDYYGAAYSMLSSLATAGLNTVVCDIPARDEGEFNSFPQNAPSTDISVEFYRTWFAWADANMPTLRRTKALPYPPGPGVVDGSYAMIQGQYGYWSGFIFLFNPNSRAMQSPMLTIDTSLDITCTADENLMFVLTELYPVSRNLTSLNCGATIQLPMEGRSALVLQITQQWRTEHREQQASNVDDAMMVLGRAARADTSAELRGDDLHISGTVEDYGRSHYELHRPATPSALYVQMHWQTFKRWSRQVFINGRAVRSAVLSVDREATSGDAGAFAEHVVVAVDVHMRDQGSFVHSQPVQSINYDPSFTGGTVHGTVNLPLSVLQQLNTRAAAYPVPWVSSDLAISWLAPARPMLYIDVGQALPSTAVVTATLNGRTVNVLLTYGCRSAMREQCFSGFWIDLAAAGVSADTDYALTVTLPSMSKGAFQGVFYDNINTVYSSEIQ
eukprot:TRINITY_DN11315_c0_g1_i1.p1 TRINITY_DN11315_c0_g1~~TRINITY_DN11315_c0_g1_i1.p1  ORF type:complete len:1142 (-),score=234.82 TRINITY_DN11315_c0_g1_i1:23-3307(-)